MHLRWIGGLLTMLGLSAVAVSARGADTDCWQMIGAAFGHSANAPHAKFITYDERSAITVDRRTLSYARASVTYREDGLAYVNDNRFAGPFTSMVPEPGPPVLGPYADARAAWLAMNNDSKTPLPVIAHVYAYPNESCRDVGVADLSGATHHLVVGDEHFNRAGLREIWIDPLAMEIKRVVIRAPIQFFSAMSSGDVAKVQTDYVVDIEDVNGYAVVRRVTWQYRDDQHAEFSAQYDFLNYRFSDVPPPGTFGA